MPLHIVIGSCSECGEKTMVHPELYIYTCLFCRFSYRINPVDRYKDITVLHKSERGKK